MLMVFLLIGGVWAYQRIDDEVRKAVGVEQVAPSAQQKAAIDRLDQAQLALAQAEQERAAARDNLEFRREAYRTALDAGRQAPALERAYIAAQGRLGRAENAVDEAQRAVAAARPAGERAQEEISEEYESRQDRRELITFLLRLLFAAASVAFAYWLLGTLRRRGSRYFPVALAVVGYAAILAFILATDYITDYVDPLDLGPLVLSLFGIALTLVAFVGLQRYLARRIPVRRVRKRECPFCGYPVRANERCEGCGRAVVAPCSSCGSERRVGTLHCGACGAL